MPHAPGYNLQFVVLSFNPEPFQHFCVHGELLQAPGVLLAVQLRVPLSWLLGGGTGSQQLRSGAEQSNCRRPWPETTAGGGGGEGISCWRWE